MPPAGRVQKVQILFASAHSKILADSLVTLMCLVSVDLMKKMKLKGSGRGRVVPIRLPHPSIGTSVSQLPA
jgi:hypothetical protein